MSTLHLVVLAAGAWAILALAASLLRVRAYGRRVLFAKAAGDPATGVRYAFTKGMRPTAKESVQTAMPSFLAGTAYHVGVFSAFALLALELAGLSVARLGLSALVAARALTLAGALSGLALLTKRTVEPHLRRLSCPDDYLSNTLATAFAALACAATFSPGLRAPWLAAAAALLVYAPLGKIRHCAFFFSSRYHLGSFFGRRGTYPPVERP